MIFNPIRKREVIEEGSLARVLRTQYDPKAPMGNVASCDLADVLGSWLVGLHDDIAPVIPRSLEWLDRAIAEKEYDRLTIPSAHRAALYWAKALGLWMRDSKNDEATWKVAQDARTEYLQTGFVKVLGPDKFDYQLQRFVPQEKRGLPFSSKQILKDGLLDDYMAFAFQAGEYETGVAEYEKHLIPNKPSLKKVLKPRDIAYAKCLQKLGRAQFDQDDLLKAGRKMLQANLEDRWLGSGQFIRAATWLKIVYWHYDESLNALETVLKAYDNMPHVLRPDFV